MRIAFILSLYLVFFSSCKALKKSKSTIKEIEGKKLIVTASNLSEDMTIFSTKDDEILLIVFGYDKDDNLQQLTKEEHVFNKGESIEISFNYKKGEFHFLLIEQDEFEPVSDEVIVEKIDFLHKAWLEKDYAMIESILKDDDVLGFHALDWDGKSKELFTIKGVYKLDRYSYYFEIR